MKITSRSDRPSNMFAPLLDPANLITILGAALSISALHFALTSQHRIALGLTAFAVAADWIDGVVARKTPVRIKFAAQVGPFIDCFADFLSGAVVPAAILYSLVPNTWVAFAGTLIVTLAGIIRLSYFNAFGVSDDNRSTGFPIVHNIPILASVSLVLIPGEPAFGIVIPMLIVFFAAMNVASFPFPRGTATATLVMTLLCLALGIANLISA